MQLERLTVLKTLVKKLNPLLKKYENLKDLIVFGSFVKSKIKPKDIDVAVLLNNKIKLKQIEKDLLKIEGVGEKAVSEVKKALKKISMELKS